MIKLTKPTIKKYQYKTVETHVRSLIIIAELFQISFFSCDFALVTKCSHNYYK